MRGLIGKAFSGTSVEQVLDTFDLRLGEFGKVAPFCEILPDQSIGVFVESPFPRMVGMGEIPFGFQLFGDLLVSVTRSTTIQ